MKHAREHKVFGHHLPAPRPTLWVPFLIATVLSMPVAVLSLVVWVVQ